MTEIEQEFTQLVRSGTSHTQLMRAAMLLNRLADPSLSLDACEARLDALALQASFRLGNHEASLARATSLCRFLAHEQSFLGNRADYYSADNSYIDRVIQTKRGIPISLALLYMHVARSHGWAIYGVSFPGHFLLAVYEGGPDGLQAGGQSDQFTLVDPFRGVVLKREECLALLQQRYGESIQLQDRFFLRADNQALLRRMLGNLKHNSIQAEQFGPALDMVNRLLKIWPDDIAELHDRAAILEHLHCYAAAAADLELIKNNRPDHPRLAEITQSIHRLNKLATPTLH